MLDEGDRRRLGRFRRRGEVQVAGGAGGGDTAGPARSPSGVAARRAEAGATETAAAKVSSDDPVQVR